MSSSLKNLLTKRISVALLSGLVVGGVASHTLLRSLTVVEEAKSVVSAEIGYSLPIKLSVPAVGIEAEFEAPVGIDAEGEMEVPKNYDTVAWYKHGPTPGELGPTVIVGHVDSEKGPEVFQPLKDVKEGDEIKVKREDGTTMVFRVYDVAYHSRKKFPVGKIFGDVDQPEIRLITCGGFFDYFKRSYSHNLVVYGTLARVETVASTTDDKM